MPKRVLAVVLIASVVAGAAFYLLRREDAPRPGSMTQEEMARSVGGPVMVNLVRGHVPGRSGEIMLVPKPNNFLISDWDLRSLGSDTPEIKTTHPDPWSYLTRVPLVLRGSVAPKGREIGDPVDISNLAPTYAQILGLDLGAPSCTLEVIVSCDGEERATRRPKAIVTVILDGGGWNLLDRYPDAWPNIKRLMREGVTYTRATVGSAPSTTGALHATFGTGFYPMDNGIPGNVLRDDNNEIIDIYYGKDSDLRYLLKPTVSELWDERNDNEAIVGTLSIENWHLGMIGQGALREGGDKDLAAFWDRENERWIVNDEFFELPGYLRRTDLGRLARYEEELDARDGKQGDGWFGDDVGALRRNKNARPASPAFVRFMGDSAVNMLTREGVGDDEVTDLIWIEMKMPDSAGHAWNMINPEVEDVLKETDAQVGRFVEALDQTLGRDDYLFTVSADHGQQPLPDDIGGWRINTGEMERDLVTTFGPIVQDATPADLYLDPEQLEAANVSIEEVATWLGAYTLGENLPDDAPGRQLVPEDRLDDRLFAAAFTTDFLTDPTVDVESLGPGDYGADGRFPVTYDVGG